MTDTPRVLIDIAASATKLNCAAPYMRPPCRGKVIGLSATWGWNGGFLVHPVCRKHWEGASK